MSLLLCGAAFAAPARLSLGDATVSGDHFVVPIYVEGNVARLEALALRVNYPHEAFASASMHRAGIAAGPAPLFETSVNGKDAVGFIASFDQAVAESSNLDRSVIAEIEFTLAPNAPNALQLSLDPAICTLGEKSGTNMLSVANGMLTVSGASIDRGGRSRSAEH